MSRELTFDATNCKRDLAIAKYKASSIPPVVAHRLGPQADALAATIRRLARRREVDAEEQESHNDCSPQEHRKDEDEAARPSLHASCQGRLLGHDEQRRRDRDRHG